MVLLPQKQLTLRFIHFFFGGGEMGPTSKDFFVCEKLTHFRGTFLHTLTCEYPPGFEMPFFFFLHLLNTTFRVHLMICNLIRST